MTTFALALKSEIARIARKVLKAELVALRKTGANHRLEIAALKREVKTLRAQVKAGQRLTQVVKGQGPAAVGKKPGRKPGFSAKAFAAQRAKLGLTQMQMAKLLGVSMLSVSKWESGKVQPRAAQLSRIIAARGTGKRKALEHLSKLGVQ